MSYPGGKGASGVAQTIINQQPPHRVYIETFAGAAAVLRAKRPAAVNIAIDLDPACTENLHRAGLPEVTIVTGDAARYLKSHPPTADTLIYADPPYPLASRRRARRLYTCEMSDAGHIRLLETLRGLSCMVQISTYPNDLYADMLSNWRLLKFQGMSRGGVMEEHLYMNYPPPAALHDYSHLGADFRDRERIQRKTKRWTARISALGELERLALMSAMAETLSGIPPREK